MDSKVPFDYYRNLTPRQRRTYDESDRIVKVELGDASRFRRQVIALRNGLRDGSRRRVQQASEKLARELCDVLGISRVRVHVGGRRPEDERGAELYGLCSWDEEETKGALIEVWMLTAAQGRPVAFKTFLRTLVHELCHHLDYELHGLDNTFHTEGFFRRESSIVRQLLPPEPEPAMEPDPEPDPEPTGQLELPF